MSQSATDFRDSQEATFRRMMREQIRKGPFTKGQRDVVLAFINHWFHHRNSKDGMVHPGRKKIAKKAGVTIKTVSRVLELLRHYGVIVAVDHLNGLRGNATLYSVSPIHLTALCSLSKDEIRYTVGHLSQPKGGTKCPTVLRDASNVIPFPMARGAA